MRKNWPRCPKCRSQEITVTEIWAGHGISWEPDTDEDAGVLEAGDPEHVEGECNNCGHKWRLRKTIQVDPAWFIDE